MSTHMCTSNSLTSHRRVVFPVSLFFPVLLVVNLSHVFLPRMNNFTFSFGDDGGGENKAGRSAAGFLDFLF